VGEWFFRTLCPHQALGNRARGRPPSRHQRENYPVDPVTAAPPPDRPPAVRTSQAARLTSGCAAGGLVGVLSGMIGLGGAEFRLPLLIGLFGFAALAAVIVNKALSLVVVITALPARLVAVPAADLTPHWPVVLNLLAGSLLGAWLGATWATKMRSATLHQVLAALLILIAAVLAVNHFADLPTLHLAPTMQVSIGLAAGAGIGIVAALMGVAGGELLIPTIVLLYSLDIKVAGSLSLAVSLPTMLVAFTRYSRDNSFRVLLDQSRFVVAMAVGSVIGVFVGGLLLGIVPELVLVPLLATLLLLSAIKVWTHR
jgi:uncharacterized membrane protein YfcA